MSQTAQQIIASQVLNTYTVLCSAYTPYSTTFNTTYASYANFTRGLTNIINNTYASSDIINVLNLYQQIITPNAFSNTTGVNLTSIMKSASLSLSASGGAFVGIANLFISTYPLVTASLSLLLTPAS